MLAPAREDGGHVGGVGNNDAGAEARVVPHVHKASSSVRADLPPLVLPAHVYSPSPSPKRAPRRLPPPPPPLAGIGDVSWLQRAATTTTAAAAANTAPAIADRPTSTFTTTAVHDEQHVHDPLRPLLPLPQPSPPPHASAPSTPPPLVTSVVPQVVSGGAAEPAAVDGGERIAPEAGSPALVNNGNDNERADGQHVLVAAAAAVEAASLGTVAPASAPHDDDDNAYAAIDRQHAIHASQAPAVQQTRETLPSPAHTALAAVIVEPQPLSRYRGRDRLVTSSSSDDHNDDDGDAAADGNSARRVQQPAAVHSMRAKPCDADPFGDAANVADAELSPPSAPTHAPAHQMQQQHHQQQRHQQQQQRYSSPSQFPAYVPSPSRLPLAANVESADALERCTRYPSPAAILIPPSLADSHSQHQPRTPPPQRTAANRNVHDARQLSLQQQPANERQSYHDQQRQRVTKFDSNGQRERDHRAASGAQQPSSLSSSSLPLPRTPSRADMRDARAPWSRESFASTTSAAGGLHDSTITWSRGTMTTSSTMPLPFDEFRRRRAPSASATLQHDAVGDEHVTSESPWRRGAGGVGGGGQMTFGAGTASSALRTVQLRRRRDDVAPSSAARATPDYNAWYDRRAHAASAAAALAPATSGRDDADDHDGDGNDDDDESTAERSGIEVAKMHILARPQLLLNVFTFWINLLACHGTVDHNQRVYGILSDLRAHFARMVSRRKRREAGDDEKIERALGASQRVLDDLRANLDDRAYDTTRSIVGVVNAVGPYVLRNYLVREGVVSLDPTASDTAVVWANVVAASDPTMPYEGTRKLTDPGEMLDRMAWSKRIPIPGL